MVNNIYSEFEWLNNTNFKIKIIKKKVNYFCAFTADIVNHLHTDTTSNSQISARPVKTLLWKDHLGSWLEF